MNNSYVKKTPNFQEKKEDTSKYCHFPVANFQLLQNLTKGITYHRETACCFSVVHSVTDTMLEPDLKQRSISFININSWYS